MLSIRVLKPVKYILIFYFHLISPRKLNSAKQKLKQLQELVKKIQQVSLTFDKVMQSAILLTYMFTLFMKSKQHPDSVFCTGHCLKV